MNYKDRTISYREKGWVHSLFEPLVYAFTALDNESGIKGKVKHYKQSEDAVKDAVLEVIKKLREQGIIKDWFAFLVSTTQYNLYIKNSL